MTQTFRCSACGYSWGPFAVSPFDPEDPEPELYLYCEKCREPQVRRAPAGAVAGLRCVYCSHPFLFSLARCPRCGTGEVSFES